MVDLDDNRIIIRQIINLSWIDEERCSSMYIYWDHFYKYLFIEQSGWFER